MRVLLVIALAVAGASAGLVKNCPLHDVPTQDHLDEHRVSGVWFERRFYYSSRFQHPPTYEDFAIIINPAKEGLYVTERERNKGKCETQNEGLRKRIGNAKYVYDKKEIKRSNVNFWVVETDYHNYLIEFSCLEVDGDYCRLPEVIVYTRRPKGDWYDKAVHRAEQLLPHLCVDPHAFYDTDQHPPGCVDRKYGYGGYGYGYDNKGYGYGYPGYGYGYGYPYGYDGYYGYGKYDDKDYKYDPKDYGKYGYGYGYGYGKGYYGVKCPATGRIGDPNKCPFLNAVRTRLNKEIAKFDAVTHTEELKQAKLKLEIDLLKKYPRRPY